MKTVTYRLPHGIHPALAPRQTGFSPDTKDKAGRVIPGKPQYEYKVVTTPEAENHDELVAQIDPSVENPDETIDALAQGAIDILRQRYGRDLASSQEAADRIDGKHPDTADLDEYDRIEATHRWVQDEMNAWTHGGKRVATGGQTAAAKAALKREQEVEKAAAENPAIKALRDRLNAELAALGLG